MCEAAGIAQCSQNLMRVRFGKNAGIMRVHFLLKCGYYAGIKSQKCRYITVKMRALCGLFLKVRYLFFPFYIYKNTLFPLHLEASSTLSSQERITKIKDFFTNILNNQHIMFEHNFLFLELESLCKSS